MNKRIVKLLTAILAVTAVFAAMAPGILAEEAGPFLTIVAGEGETKIAWDELTLVPVQGTTINGRGEEKAIDAEGVALQSLMDLAGSADELSEEGKVFLIRSEDGLRLIVFGDEDSRRIVRDVVQVIVE